MPFDSLPQKSSLPAEVLTGWSLNQLAISRLRFARNQIAEGHWCQRTSDDGNGNRCAVGWAGSEELGTDVADRAITYLEAALPPSVKTVPYYNDTRTRKTVIRLFDRAIELADLCVQREEQV
jgi:hypothetical protein